VPHIALLGSTQLAPAVGQAWAIVLRLVLAIAGSLVLLGVIDYFFQRWRHEQSLRMSRDQIKDETKREEGDPQVKGRIRRLQRETARKKMYQLVKTATVVVTNPTHLAIALRYDRGQRAAPRVVAKGAGHVAKRIAGLARQHGVPVLERKSLAQAIFRAVKLNQEIPLALYHAVAEVLAAVYRLRGAVPAGKPPENAPGEGP
jgi:flagellar biosynthesis protein FlhB